MYFFVKRINNLIIIGLLFLFTIIVGQTTMAQSQTEFVRNDKANPLQRFEVASARQSQPTFVDIDNDGDLDCFSGEFNYSKNEVVSSHISFFKNEGNAKHPLFTEIKNAGNPLFAATITGLVIPVFSDIDNDGDMDCFIADDAGAISFYENTGTALQAKFVKQSAAFNPLSAIKFAGISISHFILSDMDADGDMDCLVADNDGNEAYFINIGSASKPHFVSTEKNDLFAVIKNIPVNTLSLYDWNKDGRTDLFVNGAYYENHVTSFTKTFSSAAFNNSNNNATCWVDLNNDGTPEIISGTSEGTFTYSTLASVTAKAITSILISPNPTTNNFTVILPASDDIRTLRVVNAGGKIILSQNIKAGSYVFGDNFSTGTYFVQIISSGNKIAEQKIMKL